MRLLFSCTAAEGHFRPLVPLAEEAARQGHELVFASAGSFRDRVGSAGFAVLAAGIDRDELETRYAPYWKQLLEIEPTERRPYGFAWRYGAIDGPAKVDELLAAATDWRPDVIVHESADLAAPLVADMLGIHSVHHGFGRRVPTICFEQAAQHMNVVWATHGLAPPALCGAFRGDYIDICPPSIRPATVDDGVPVLEMRVSGEIGGTSQRPWGTGLRGRTVYVTLGTMFNDLSIFRVLLDGLSNVDCSVVATIGRDNDPERLGSIPTNMIVERYIPQDEVLPHIAATVCHGGSGSTLAALAHGVPMLMLPQAADQFENAEVCQEIGAALALMPDEVSPESVRSAVTALLEDPEYSANARRIAEEIANMQSPSAVLAGLASRFESRRPL